jgi:hypothetical protein
MSATQSDPQPKAEKQQSTEYVVLRRVPGTTAEQGDPPAYQWVEAGRATGVNAQAAIKSIAQNEGTFIAVPTRSWKPLTRKIEKVERDLWS